VSAHLNTLKNYNSGRFRPLDFIVFYVLPTAAATALVLRGASAPQALAAALMTALPLTALILSTALPVVLRAASPAPDKQSPSRVTLQFGREVTNNLFYGMLLSVLGTSAAFADLLASPGWPKHAADFLLYSLTLHLALTLLMTLTRLHAIAGKHFDNQD
jgi:hypothetical protein